MKKSSAQTLGSLLIIEKSNQQTFPEHLLCRHCWLLKNKTDAGFKNSLPLARRAGKPKPVTNRHTYSPSMKGEVSSHQPPTHALFPRFGPLARPHFQKSRLQPQGWEGKERGEKEGDIHRSPCRSRHFCSGNSLPVEPPGRPRPRAPLLGKSRGHRLDRPQALPQSPSAKAFQPLLGKPPPCTCQEFKKEPRGQGT